MGWVLQEVWEARNTNIQKIPCEFAWDSCWD
jgi:hypothetical protein